jgi:hypothetical protein
LLIIILVLLALVLLPVVLFFGLVGLALFVWSWRRIGPYFVNLGRWIADWRNLIPLGCLGALAILGIVLFTMILPPELSLLRVILLVMVVLVGFVLAIFAFIVWTVRLAAWFWPRFRRAFWGYLERLWNGISTEGRAKARRPGKGQPPPTKVAPGEPTTDAGPALIGARPAPRGAPPARRSWLDLSWLWASVWGRPQRAAKKPKPVAKSPQSQAQAAAEPTTPARVPAKPKAGLRPLIWRLGLVAPWLQGKRGGPRAKPKPSAPKKTAETLDKPITPAAPMASQPRPTVTVPAVKPAEAKPKPTTAVRPKPKRSMLGAIRGVGRSMVAAVEALRKGFWLGIFWVMGKARAGMNYILRLLHLGGRRK